MPDKSALNQNEDASYGKRDSTSNILREPLTELVQSQLHSLGEALDIAALGAVDRGLERLFKDRGGQSADHEFLDQVAMRELNVTGLAAGVLQTSRSIQLVLGHGDIDSGYVLARAAVERAINFAFLSTCGDSDYNDWVSYGRQKEFRLLSRAQKAGNIEFQFGVEPPIDPSAVPGMKEDLLRFTGKKSGGERTRWNSLSLTDRLGAIEGKFENSSHVIMLLLQALTYVYDLGSEAQHGSSVGARLTTTVLAAQVPDTDQKSISMESNLVMIATSLCLHATLCVLAYIANHPEWDAQAGKQFLSKVKEMRKRTASTR